MSGEEATSPMFAHYQALLGSDFGGACAMLKKAHRAFNANVKLKLKTGCGGLSFMRFGEQKKALSWSCDSPNCPTCWHKRWSSHMKNLQTFDWSRFKYYYVRRTQPELVTLGVDTTFVRKFRARGCDYYTICTGSTYIQTIDGVGVMLVGLFGSHRPIYEYQCHDLEYELPPEGIMHGSLHATRERIHRLGIKPKQLDRFMQFIKPWWIGDDANLDNLASSLVEKIDNVPRPFRFVNAC